jgi:T-complex protein 1 subunit zeta
VTLIFQVLIVGEILRQCESPLAEGVHPRNLTEGLDLARTHALAALEEFKEPWDKKDTEKLLSVARCALRTKVG